MEKFVDREYKIHLTVAKVGMLYLLKLADTPVLPFTMTRYHEAITRGINAISKQMKDKNINDVDQCKCVWREVIFQIPVTRGNCRLEVS